MSRIAQLVKVNSFISYKLSLLLYSATLHLRKTSALTKLTRSSTVGSNEQTTLRKKLAQQGPNYLVDTEHVRTMAEVLQSRSSWE